MYYLRCSLFQSEYNNILFDTTFSWELLTMKFLQICITVLLVTSAVLFSGCTDSAPSQPAITTPHLTSTVIKTTVPPAVTISRQPATPVEVKKTVNMVKIFNGDYHWVEYRENNTVTMPPNPRFQWEYILKAERTDDNYQGSPAIHFKITSTSDYAEWIGDKLVNTPNGQISVSDISYNRSTNTFLGGTWTETIKGVSKTADYSAYYSHQSREGKPGGDMGITPFGEMNITLTDKGTESVTVPAGIFPNARKYTGNFLDGTPITFWVVPGIPVPVHYQFPNKYMDGVDPFQSYELKAWG
jgi:hypothetical protein